MHVFIHGGYWREGDMALWRFIAAGIVGNDVTLVLPTNDVSPDTDVRTIVEQLHKAMEWTSSNITDYGGDRLNISVSGHSAGGHLAAMLMTTVWSARGYRNDLIKATFRSCLNWSIHKARCQQPSAKSLKNTVALGERMTAHL